MSLSRRRAGGGPSAAPGQRTSPSRGWVGPAVLAAAVVAILALAVAVDPARGVTTSGSPFADEGFNAVNARNLVLLGRWSTDSWNLYLVDLPFSALLAAVFQAFGVGIVQARLVSIASIGLTVLVLGLGLRRPFGSGAAALAALAFGTSGLVLYYGRLVYQEDLVTLLLAAGAITLVGAVVSGSRLRALAAGILLALAIGSKPSAAFAVAGIILALGIAGWRVRASRSALLIAVATVAAAGLAWVGAVWLPDRTAIDRVMAIWPRFTWPDSAPSLVGRVLAYAFRNDHALLLSLPLAIGAAGGLMAAARWRSELQGEARLLAVAAIGWLAAGLGILAVASYRPNRYVVPMLPAAAILLAVFIALVGPRVRERIPRATRLAVAALLCAVLAAPGLGAYASWVVGAGSTAPAIQAEMASVVPSGSVVVGVDSALFLMRAPVTTIIPWEGLPGNEGDLYHTAGARWYLTNGDRTPGTVDLPQGVWAARQRIACATWFGTLDCLYRVP